MGSASQSNIAARIDQKTGGSTCEPLQGFTREHLQFAARQILFAKLNKVHPGSPDLLDFLQKSRPAGLFATGKLSTIGDVVEEQSQS